MRGAVWVTSSPSTSTASASSISRRLGMRSPTACKMSRIACTTAHSAAAMPVEKLSAPTNSRKAKLASTLARGEPMPISGAPRRRSAAASSAASTVAST